MGDLVRGRFPVTNPLWNVLGRNVNAFQNDLAVRSNVEYLGVGGTVDQTSLTSGVMLTVAVPVQVGDQISTVSVRVGGTAAATPTNAWAAVYAGYAPGNASAVLLAQSVTSGGAAIGASQTLTFTLSTPVVVTNVNAPNGFWYVGLMVAAGTTPSLAGASVAAAVAGPWFPGAAVLAQTSGSGLTTSAPAALAAGSAVSNNPLVFLQ